MSKVNRMLKHARAELLEVGNVEFEKKAHALWELEAADGNVIVNNKSAADEEEGEDSPEEVEVKLDVQEQPPLLPFEQGQMVMFVIGGRSFVGSVLASDEQTSVVQTGVRKYRVANDFLYSVTPAQPNVSNPQNQPPTPPMQFTEPLRGTDNDLGGGTGELPNNLLNERVLEPSAPTPPVAQPKTGPDQDYVPIDGTRQPKVTIG